MRVHLFNSGLTFDKIVEHCIFAGSELVGLSCSLNVLHKCIPENVRVRNGFADPVRTQKHIFFNAAGMRNRYKNIVASVVPTRTCKKTGK